MRAIAGCVLIICGTVLAALPVVRNILMDLYHPIPQGLQGPQIRSSPWEVMMSILGVVMIVVGYAGSFLDRREK